MANIVRLSEIRRKAKPTFFSRPELNQLLSLYSRQVARGLWRPVWRDQSRKMHAFEGETLRLTKISGYKGAATGSAEQSKQDSKSNGFVPEVMNALRMIVPATSLADVHSLMLYPAMASHRDIAPKHRARLGIHDNLVRLSVGIEAVEDIIADLDQALQA